MSLNIAYVDLEFRKKTFSTFFLSDILQKHGYNVARYWDDGNLNFADTINNDVVVLFQSIGKFDKKLRKLHPNITFIPMLDGYDLNRGCAANMSDYWRTFSGLKILNFSKALHSAVCSHGLVSRYFQYYQEPLEDISIIRNGLHGFFWCRQPNDLSFEHIRELITNTKFDSLHLHMASDLPQPKPPMPTEEEIRHHNITISTWFENKEEYNKVLSKANVFFAPRLEEGIGQAMLEAFARGQCVVSPNYGTMNEYITHGYNGLLYDMKDIKPLCFDKVPEICASTYDTAKRGYSAWMNSKDDIVKYIILPPSVFYNDPDFYHGYIIPPSSILSKIASSTMIRPFKEKMRPIWRTITKAF